MLNLRMAKTLLLVGAAFLVLLLAAPSCDQMESVKTSFIHVGDRCTGESVLLDIVKGSGR